MPTHILFRFSFLFFPLLLWTGCGGPPRPADLPPLYKTTITVTQEGAPLAGALVALYSEDQTFKWGVAGITDAAGKAEIKTHGQFSGVPLGSYKVVVTKSEPEGGSDVPTTRPDNAEGAKIKVKHVSKIQLYNLLEKQYMNVATTPLTITIEKKRNNKVFDVGKPVREAGELFEL